MNVNAISPTAAISSQAGAGGSSSAATTRTSEEAEATPQIDKTTGEPVAPRFPWLSRLTAQLEKASNKPSPYGASTPLGENIDQKI